MTIKNLLIPDFKSLKAAIKNSNSQPRESTSTSQDLEEIQSVGPSTQIGRYSSQISFVGGHDSQENEPPKSVPIKTRRRSLSLHTQPIFEKTNPSATSPPVCVKRILPTDPNQYFKKYFPWSDNLLDLNVSVFGNKNGFREHQLEAVNAVMDQYDVFVILPTGGGKSLIFQLPALASPGLTVVIMPLVSLINDQVQHMNRLGVPVASLVGEVSRPQIDTIFRDIRDNKVSILYVTPERISKSTTLLDLFHQLSSNNCLTRFVIDEAHCVSTMGHSFRADYLELKILRSKFPHIPILALTATATSAVVTDVLNQLALTQSSVYITRGSLDRPNLKWQVFEKKRSLSEDICRIIKTDYSDGSSGIIYCLSQAQCEKVANELRSSGVRAGHYHAAMSQKDRETVQRQWMEESIQVVCATIAFGMGINKPNVRFVMHHSMPKSIENLYQEQGRAGRDGIPSRCILYYDYADKIRNHGLINSDGGNNTSHQIESLVQVVRYCEDKVTCRRQFFASHFGELGKQEDCRNVIGAQLCDVCESGSNLVNNIVIEDCTSIGIKILEILEELHGKHFGGRGGKYPTAMQLRDIVTGTLGNRGEWTRLKNFACLRGEWSMNVKLIDLIHKMIVDGWIEEICELNNYNGYTGYVRMGRRRDELVCKTPKIGLVDTFQFERAIRSALIESRPVAPVAEPKRHPLSNDQRIELKGALNHLRSQIAKEEKTLAFEVFPDTTVLDLIEQLPKKLDDLQDVDKLNDRKIALYGERIVECIRGFMEEQGLGSFVSTMNTAPVAKPSLQEQPIRLVTNSKGDMSLKDSQSTAVSSNETYATRFTKKRKSSASEKAATPHAGIDEITNLSDEAIIDLCTSPIIPQKLSQSNRVQFEDISEEYLQWLKEEGVI